MEQFYVKAARRHPYLSNALNYAYRNGLVSVIQRRGLITLIPRKNKAANLLKISDQLLFLTSTTKLPLNASRAEYKSFCQG